MKNAGPAAAIRSGAAADKAPERRSALWVIGMHRSGTSFLAQAVAGLGFALPKDRAGGLPDNLHGHFEPRSVVELNSALLAALGSGWDRVSPVTAEEIGRFAAGGLARDMQAALRASFGRSTRIVVKDPRLSLLLPLWRETLGPALTDERCLIALRHPVAVAASLCRRDGIAPELAMMLWLGHTLAALRVSEGLRRVCVVFPDWVAHPDRTLALLDRRLSLPAADPRRQALRFGRTFDASAVHETGSGVAQTGPLSDLAIGLFEALKLTAEDGREPDAGLLASAESGFLRLTEAVRHCERRAAARLIESCGIPAGDRRQPAPMVPLARLRATEAQRDAALAEAAGRMRDAQAVIAQLRATEAQRDGERARAEARQADACALARTLRQTEAQRDDATAQVRARWKDALALQAQLRATEAQRDALAIAGEQERARAEALSSDLERAAADLREAGARAELANGQRTALAGQLAQAEGEAVRLRAELERQSALLAARDAALAATGAALSEYELLYRKERMTVLRPIYRHIYRLGGRMLRRALPPGQIERIRRALPHPDGIPAHLAAQHPLRPAACLALPPAAAPAGGSELPGLLPADPAGPADIFMLSIIDWDFRTQRPQHLARAFAAHGHRVFYVEMEPGPGGTQTRPVAPGVQVVRLGSRRTGTVPAYTGVPSPAQAEAWIDSFEEFCAAVGATPTRTLIVQHPYWWEFVRHLPSENQITFDCMDEISGFSNTEPHVLAAEEALIAGCDRMIASSRYLHEKHRHRRELALVHNAADLTAFRAEGGAPPVPAFLSGHLVPDRTRVGYVGAIAEWFDADLVREVARLCPEARFHLCGSVTAPAPAALGKLPNVTLHGEIAYSDVPGFIAAMDVMIIPFRLLPIIQACDPVKFYEHAAAMKPTVATRLPELDRAGDLVTIADDAEAFASGIGRALQLGRDPEHRRRLRAYAKANTWEGRARDMLAHVTRFPMVSVVVLSYGNADFTLATLHSLAGHGPAYPNLEIIVVDNGSDEADLARLRPAVAALPQGRLIETGRNLGFARGNNIGIEAARGDYVLLLNNDTFVPPGAIAAMVRHLERAPEIGVVGPLTNNIGNEARIPVEYADMQEMVAASRRVTRGYRGRWTEVEVCAYFCAMFRRGDFRRFGLLPEDYGLGMFEDDDHCARIRATGLRCALAEDAFVHHHLSASFDALGQERKRAIFDENRARFESRWGQWSPHRYRAARPKSALEVA